MTEIKLTTTEGVVEVNYASEVRRAIRNTSTFWLAFGWGLGMALGELHARGLL